MRSPRSLLVAGGIALSSVSPALADVPRCDAVLEGAKFLGGKDQEVTARHAEHVRAVCTAHDSSADRWSRLLADLHVDAAAMIAAANSKNWNAVADRLDHAAPLLEQLAAQAKADTAEPRTASEPADPRLTGFVKLATDGYRERLYQPASLHPLPCVPVSPICRVHCARTATASSLARPMCWSWTCPATPTISPASSPMKRRATNATIRRD